MKFIKNVLIFILTIALLVGLYIGGNLIYGTLTDFNPDASEIVAVENGQTAKAEDSTFTFLTWNIGYGGLGAKADFFYDGGKMVVSPEADVKAYLDGIKNFLKSKDQTDFILLQEVDRNSKRSYYNDELKHIAAFLPNHSYAYAKNYVVEFVPVPYLSPMGKVDAGLGSYSKYRVEEAMRYQLPGSFPWPKRIYFLDRCILTQRVKLANGKELVVVNLHNSAYDDTGELKAQELNYIKEFLLKEFQKGNYLVVGGDWNQTPNEWNNKTYTKTGDDYVPANIPADYLPDWQWAYDASSPTNRNLKTAYDKETTSCTVIDFFLVSPNLKVEAIATHNLDFAFSDHQPVSLKVSLR